MQSHRDSPCSDSSDLLKDLEGRATIVLRCGDFKWCFCALLHGPSKARGCFWLCCRRREASGALVWSPFAWYLKDVT